MDNPTPGWHFACSETGYTNSTISLEWMQKVFDASTRCRANGRPRLLISDGFGTHESLEVLTFCYENNIILCRLPSHTSHKLQPCDVGVFGPLKAAYQEQVDRVFRGGANVVGKQHFTLLYDRARQIAITKRNISSGWSKAGLFPFCSERVLRDMPKPRQDVNNALSPASNRSTYSQLHSPLKTPTTAKSLENILSNTEARFAKASDDDTWVYFQKVAKAAQKAFADRALAWDENQHLTVQNNEKKTREAGRSTVVGKAKVMSYEDIVEARKKRDLKIAKNSDRGRRKPKRKVEEPHPPPKTQARKDELILAEREVVASGLADFCTVFRL